MCVHACAQSLGGVLLFDTPGTVDRKAPLSMEFPREEYWSFDKDCTESVDCFDKYGHFNNINNSSSQ